MTRQDSTDETPRFNTPPAHTLWKHLRPLARQMRREPTPAERVLWEHLRNDQIEGMEFRRQHVIDRFIVDFYCSQAYLVIEVDGSIHDETGPEDAARQEILESLGLRVVRFTNEQVLTDTEMVIEQIRALLADRPHSHEPAGFAPSPRGREGEQSVPDGGSASPFSITWGKGPGDRGHDFRCELHMHSYFSDGMVSPTDLLTHAAGMGLAVVAITDHDTADGVRSARPVAQALGLELIPAIEFTSRWDGVTAPGKIADVDVLGYFLDLDDPVLRAVEQAALADIEARIAACCIRLTRAGYPLTLAGVRAQNPRYAGLRQAVAALIAAGYASDERAGYALIMSHWLDGRPSSFTVGEIIAAIRGAGGVAVLAHPCQIETEAGWITAEQVAALAALGLDGLEVYHRSLDSDARAYFGALAEQFGLIVTGGSDEHGWSPSLPLMGQQPVTRAMVEALRTRAHRPNPKGHAQ